MIAKIVIEIVGGNLQNVYSDLPLEVLLIDWDNIAAGDCPPGKLLFADGTTAEDVARTEKSVL